MINLNTLYLIVGLHFGIILVSLLICLITGKVPYRREHVVPIVAIPIFGLLIGLGIQLVHWTGRSDKKPVDMELMHLGSDIYWRSLKKPQENLDIVPLEEAINLDSYGVRRRILLDALFEKPSKHIQVLMVARHNEDAETAHYAATTIEKIQRDFQMDIQGYAAYLKQHPNDPEILDAYIRLLEKYIESGLMDTHMAGRQRKILSELLDQKLSFNPSDKLTLIKKLRNHLALSEYSTCIEISKLLRMWWPNDEDIWIESLRISVEAQNQQLFQEIVEGVHTTDVDWSKSGRDQLAYWIEGFSYG